LPHLQLPPLHRPEQQFLSLVQLAPVPPHPAAATCAAASRAERNPNGPATKPAINPVMA
jgi:hypothetical protein